MPLVRRRAHYQHVTQFERGRIIGMQGVGLSYTYRPIGQSLIAWNEMWPLCYGIVVPGLKKEDTAQEGGLQIDTTAIFDFWPLGIDFRQLER
jgi:hypothetical protein